MVEFGYALSSEEHRPNDLVRYAQRAEEAGFTFAMISDHYHPWIDDQGHSPFVWSVIGGIAQVTKSIRLGTGVTCPTVRIHPAIIAQASATAADMLPGRFMLGLGTGEALNEHIVGEHWPSADTRIDMLAEAIDIIRLLWEGKESSYGGAFFTVENARIYTLPEELPPIYVASSGPESAALAAVNDGIISTAPNPAVFKSFEESGGAGKPRLGQLTVSWAQSEAEGRRVAHKQWRNTTVPGPVMPDIPRPAQFEALTEKTSEDEVAQAITCGPDVSKYIEQVRSYADAGFDHIYFHQVGGDQEGFFQFYERELMPALSREFGGEARMRKSA